ncbi:MAG: insulinase family protein [Chlamydiia bacterium]|nr:insulinase family protein [Chlamydiia bacterium]
MSLPFFALVVLSLFTTTLPGTEEIRDTRDLMYLNPQMQNRATKKIRLDNGIEALLISDPTSEDAGVALTVKAGSWDEPENSEGLAHFLEHMLFMGTEAYPVESEYDSVLSRYRGKSNAFTYTDITSYMFSVKKEGFEEVLKRFSSFFKAPLFNPSGVDREVRAIDQEFRMNKEKDSFLKLQVLKELSLSDHPFSRFNSGNKESLKNTSREELKAWYETTYSADKMRLWVFAPFSLDEIQAKVEDAFKSVPIRSTKEADYPEFFLKEDAKGKMVLMRPIQDERELSLMWELSETLSQSTDEKPWNQIAWILGSEGENSLLDTLKKEGLATGLSAGDLGLSSKKRLFFIDVELTSEGEKQWKRVVEVIFQAIELLKEQGISHSLFDTIQGLQKLNYQWTAPKDVFSEAMSHAFTQGYEPLESYPERTFVAKKYDAKKIQEMLQGMTPDNALYFLLTPDVKDPKAYQKLEKWTQTPYSIESMDLSPYKTVELNPNIRLPTENPYIPTDFKVKYAGGEKTWDSELNPETLFDTGQGKLYFLQDPYFLVPQAYLSFEVKTPVVTDAIPKSALMRDLWIKLYNQLLSGPLYDAKLAGVDIKLEPAEEGVRFILNGYTDKLPQILSRIENGLKLKGLTEKQYHQMVRELERELKNSALDTPIKQAIEAFKSAIYKPWSSPNDKLKALSRLKYDQFLKFNERLFERSYTEGVILGNFTSKEASVIWKEWVRSLGKKGYPVKEQKPQEVIELSQKKGPFKKVKKIHAQGNGFILGIESEIFSAKARGVQQLLQQVVDKAFFKELRTLQQTGYLVAVVAEDLKKHLFTLFLVQSATLRPEELLWRVETFIDQFTRDLKENLSEADFQIAKEALLKQLQEKPKALNELGELMVKLGFELDGDFSWLKQRETSLKELSYQAFLEEAHSYLGRKNRRRLGVLADGEDKMPFQYKTLLEK